MQNKKEDNVNNLVSLMFFIVALFLFCSLAAPTHTNTKVTNSCQLSEKFHSNPPGALLAETCEMPQVRCSCMLSLIKASIPDFGLGHKNTTDTKKIQQQLLSLNRIEYLLQPNDFPRIYYHLFPISEEPPVLS